MNSDQSKFSITHRSGERGGRHEPSNFRVKDGDVMTIAEEDVVSSHPSNSIKNVAKIMLENDFRRIPVTDAGSLRLEGMAKSIDIIDFLGGGEKYNIIVKDYKSNFLSAINCPISKIMSEPVYLEKKSSVDDAVELMISQKTSSIPIVEDDDSLKVIAILTERDVLPNAADFGIPVSEIMREDVVTASPGMMLADVSKVMVRNRLRRLPVVSEDEVVGIVTQFDILKFLAKGEFVGVTDKENLSIRVSDIMTKEIISVSPEDDVSEFVKLVKESGLGGFPVMESREIEGILTTMDLISHIYK